MKGLALLETAVDVEPSGLCTVFLNRPERGNGMTLRMFEELDWIFRTANEDDSVKMLLVAGKGPRFCVGADLAPTASTTEGPPLARDEAGIAALSVSRCRKVVIVALHGAAVGGGVTVFLPADILVAEEDCKIAFPFVRRGLTMEATSSFHLPKRVGLGKALDLCLTGRTFLAKEEPGLFTKIVGTGQALTQARAIGLDILANASQVSLVLVKASLRANVQHPLDAHEIESRFMQQCKSTGQFAEGKRSFVEKRAPQFPGSARAADYAAIDQWTHARTAPPTRSAKL